MTRVAVRAALPKPLPGDPCNGCGGCCLATKCLLGMGLFGEELGRCPALERDGERYVCGAIAHPRRYAGDNQASDETLSRAAEIAIGVGTGCDSRREGDPPFTREHGRAMVRAFAMWLGPGPAAKLLIENVLR